MMEDRIPDPVSRIDNFRDRSADVPRYEAIEDARKRRDRRPPPRRHAPVARTRPAQEVDEDVLVGTHLDVRA